ncbi:hypothetical protein Y032_0039g119 [Ancylostoma ceylanicum]|uniref:Reverse transcriptase domain-containing protein n=1 Tax=Ancylostoma ceylanicum TaxID=53326 RepID=A0A016UH84_9BILA|nr:hypothetical protein Y032_0039g119 [Ancylostoma ceylanicum]
MLYVNHRSKVQAAAGTSTEFPITVGVHQGSALSPLLLIVVMDALTKDLQRPAPWTLLYADDIMLASEDKDELERQTQAWSDRLARCDIRLNIKKTEYLTTGEHESGTIKINGTDLREPLRSGTSVQWCHQTAVSLMKSPHVQRCVSEVALTDRCAV